jgi:hypothetical protein
MFRQSRAGPGIDQLAVITAKQCGLPPVRREIIHAFESHRRFALRTQRPLKQPKRKLNHIGGLTRVSTTILTQPLGERLQYDKHKQRLKRIQVPNEHGCRIQPLLRLNGSARAHICKEGAKRAGSLEWESQGLRETGNVAPVAATAKKARRPVPARTTLRCRRS